MASSGALAPFLSAMTQIRAQRLEQAIAREKIIQQGYGALASGIGSFGSSIGGAIGTMGTTGAANVTANTAMNQAMPPRAQAVGPNAGTINAQAARAPLQGQIPYEQVPVSMSPHTGGVAEFGLRQKMGQIEQQKPTDIIRQLQFEMQVDRFNRQKEEERKAGVDKSFNSMTKQAKEIYVDSKGYIDSATEMVKNATTATDRDTYNLYANQLRALNSVHQGRKLNTEMLTPPPFMSQEDKDAMKNLETAQRGMQGQSPTTMFGMAESGPAANLRMAEEAARGRMSLPTDSPLGGMAGTKPSGVSQGAIPVPPSGSSKPDGTKAYGKDGRLYEKRGSFMVPVQ